MYKMYKKGWPRGNARISGIPRICVEDALTCVRAKKMREPRNPINGLLALHNLVRLFACYRSRPHRMKIASDGRYDRDPAVLGDGRDRLAARA
jgi:hypothetical protein